MVWWTKAVYFTMADLAFTSVFIEAFSALLSLGQKICVVIVSLLLILCAFILASSAREVKPVRPEQDSQTPTPIPTPTHGTAVLTREGVTSFQPDRISREEAIRIAANAVRDAVRGQGRRMSGEPAIASAELRRDEGLWYLQGSYAWQTRILQAVSFHAQLNAKTGQVSTLSFDN